MNGNERIREKKAFTLIEMLVVIAIIVVLVSLIFTGFAKARERTYVIKTQSNLRQLYQANVQHALEYRGFYVPHNAHNARTNPNNVDWLNNRRFQEYLGGQQNGWDDWPSVFKTGRPIRNPDSSNPGWTSRGTIGMHLGWNGEQWFLDHAFHANVLNQWPRMIMFADATTYYIRGHRAELGQGISFRYDGKANVIRNNGSVSLVSWSDLFPVSNPREVWPRESQEKVARVDFHYLSPYVDP
jgi:prepilin-type N-terminal cleavage/methylation domain-containing protein